MGLFAAASFPGCSVGFTSAPSVPTCVCQRDHTNLTALSPQPLRHCRSCQHYSGGSTSQITGSLLPDPGWSALPNLALPAHLCCQGYYADLNTQPSSLTPPPLSIRPSNYHLLNAFSTDVWPDCSSLSVWSACDVKHTRPKSFSSFVFFLRCFISLSWDIYDLSVTCWL